MMIKAAPITVPAADALVQPWTPMCWLLFPW
jgi:hypothetical protein